MLNAKQYLTTHGQRSGVEVFEKGVWVQTIGRLGDGPGEFKHDPVQLAIVSGQLAVTERYRRRVSLFKLDGTYISCSEPDRMSRPLSINGRQWTFRGLDYPVAIESGFRVRNREADCFFGKMVGSSVIDHHLSAYLLAPYMDKGVLFIRRNGLVQAYDLECNLLNEWYVPVKHLARDVEPDPLGDALVRHYKKKYPDRTYLKPYLYGLPIISAAANREGVLFLITSNEHKITGERKPGECFLKVLNTVTGRRQTFPVEGAPQTVKVQENHLMLISSEDAFIKIWNIEDIP
ncbi:MAG: hypothetical protein QNK37_01705 [Acidobacteriota bacterium]|nr:hypothetical protein [Acidobacteriota bacterium]